MNLHEYQGKQILKEHNVPAPDGYVAETPEKAYEIAQNIQSNTGTNNFAVKAQIHAGGRGKGGGVKIATSPEEAKHHAENILGMNLVTHQTGSEGKKVYKVIVEQSIYYEGESEVQEYYMSILLNRNSGKNMIVYSPEGGVDIEKVAEESPNQIYKEEIHPEVGIQAYQARKIAFNLGLTGKAFKSMMKFAPALYNAYIKSDASLIEINPVIKTSDDLVLAGDTKYKIDDNALYKHPSYAEMRDLSEEDPTEVEADKNQLNFIKLNGNVGCMVNGAGLAMATMDMIKLSGGDPANFLDVGGAANPESVEAGFRLILKDTKVKAILLNIFGGIVRCDRVAKGVVEAYKSIGEIQVPVIVRLQGTNAEEGKEIIDSSGLKVSSAISLEDAAQLVKKAVG